MDLNCKIMRINTVIMIFGPRRCEIIYLGCALIYVCLDVLDIRHSLVVCAFCII